MKSKQQVSPCFDTCELCGFFKPRWIRSEHETVNGKQYVTDYQMPSVCRRFPKHEVVTPDHWCGEFSKEVK